MTSITFDELGSVISGPGNPPPAPPALREETPLTLSAEEPAAEHLEEDVAEYTIDELSATTHVSSRTIRYYQSKGALPRPIIRGRVAFYTDDHVERLTLIARLQDQGLRIKAIRDLLARADKGELVISEWLGLKAQLQAPWAQDTPRIVSEEELYEMIGVKRQGILGELMRLKVIKRERDAYHVRSPALLMVTMRLEQAGFDLDTSVKSAKILRKHLSRAAGELSEHFMKHFSQAFERDGLDLGQAFEILRPVGLEAVQLIFAQEMERALQVFIESGRTAAVASRKRPTK